MTELSKAITSFLHLFGFDIYKYSILRDMCNYVNENKKGELVGVEIGVHKGDNAKQMLKRMNLKMLYLIDPYELYNGYQDGINLNNMHNTTFNKTKKEMERKLKKYKGKYTLIEKMSEQAVNEIPDNLDFVYIDGNHEYKYVKKDIELYYKKVKDGGVFGGHDFLGLNFNDVRNAVIDFLKKYNLQLYVGYNNDWWVVKGVKREK
ncbi:MAG: class I SAM-dependent methyltransferase [Candidatus Pacearchaeota archaeon]|nr:class I SAM-dependent methyltransferase [Candidatus Pacearchaeota archaeon]